MANSARDTATSANWATVQRPWRTILASFSRSVVSDQSSTYSGGHYRWQAHGGRLGHLVQDNLALHMVTSPAFFDDHATDAGDGLREKALIFDVDPDSFRTVAAMANMLRGADYRRCP